VAGLVDIHGNLPGLDAVLSEVALAGAFLTGRYGTDRPRPKDTRIAGLGARHEQHAVTEPKLMIADAVNQIARERDASSSQIALAWVRAQQQRAVVIPIVGVRTLAPLQDNLGALQLELTSDELGRLEQVNTIEPGFPHDFDTSGLVHGTTEGLIDDHR